MTQLSQVCRRLEDLRSRRICSAVPCSAVMASLHSLGNGSDRQSLAVLVRRIVQEELPALGHELGTDFVSIHCPGPQHDANTVRHLVKDEIQLATSIPVATSSTCASVCTSTAPSPSQKCANPPSPGIVTAPLIAKRVSTWMSRTGDTTHAADRHWPISAAICLATLPVAATAGKRTSFSLPSAMHCEQRYSSNDQSRTRAGWAYESDGCDAEYFGEPRAYGEEAKGRIPRSTSPHPRRRSRSPLQQTSPKPLGAPS